MRLAAAFAVFAAVAGTLPACAHAGEVISLRNGYTLTCDHRESMGTSTRLYLDADSSSYVDIASSDITGADPAPTPAIEAQPSAAPLKSSTTVAHAARRPEAPLSAAELNQDLSSAGAVHDLDISLLASVVHAESSGRVHAVSRTGAQGLMQLMPSTAAQLGVQDAFAPSQNIDGGVAYLDALLHRYHDNLALALAAYNAGPAAVDRYHGIPPYRETRAYVARIIHEFNARYAATHTSAALAAVAH